MTYVFHVSIWKVEERKMVRHVSGAGKDAVLVDESLGWYVTFTDFTSRYFGMEKPDLAPGDKMILKLERSQ